MRTTLFSIFYIYFKNYFTFLHLVTHTHIHKQTYIYIQHTYTNTLNFTWFIFIFNFVLLIVILTSKCYIIIYLFLISFYSTVSWHISLSIFSQEYVSPCIHENENLTKFLFPIHKLSTILSPILISMEQ